MKTEVYEVYGATGEYDDRMDWTVCVYGSLEKANAKVAFLLSVAESYGVRQGDPHGPGWNQQREAAREVLSTMDNGDPDCSIDYNGIWYGVNVLPAEL